MENLKQIRLDQGKTQVEVAREVGVTLNAYIKWEQGVASPNEKNLVKLKKVLNIE